MFGVVAKTGRLIQGAEDLSRVMLAGVVALADVAQGVFHGDSAADFVVIVGRAMAARALFR